MPSPKPPLVTRGQLLNNPSKQAEVPPRFDWMQKTVHEDPRDIYELLAGTLGGELEPGRGLNGYHRSMAVKRAGETLARVLFGGPNGWPNVVTSGPATDDVAPVMRGAWDRAEVTRMDSASDFDSPGGYEAVRAILEAIHERTGLTKYELSSTKRGVTSATYYLGAPSSRVRVRLYQKGRFERQQGHAEASENWFRLEGQVRPTGADARRRASTMDALEVWGFSPTLRELARDVLGADVERVNPNLRRDPDYERALEALKRQYGATLEKLLAVEGSWDAVGHVLGVL